MLECVFIAHFYKDIQFDHFLCSHQIIVIINELMTIQTFDLIIDLLSKPIVAQMSSSKAVVIVVYLHCYWRELLELSEF